MKKAFSPSSLKCLHISCSQPFNSGFACYPDTLLYAANDYFLSIARAFHTISQLFHACRQARIPEPCHYINFRRYGCNKLRYSVFERILINTLQLILDLKTSCMKIKKSKCRNEHLKWTLPKSGETAVVGHVPRCNLT